MKKYCILGTDERTNYLRDLYIKEKAKITQLEDADYIITAIPFSKDSITLNSETIKCDDLINKLKGTDKLLISGGVSKDMLKKFEGNNIKYYDIMKDDALAIYNAIPTAEGAIAIAIENTKFNLYNSNALVLGYGRVGKILANTLNGIGANTFVEARKEKDIAQIDAFRYNSIMIDDLEKYLPRMDVIFNTIPEMILNKNRLEYIKNDALIIDLASSPGGVDFKEAKKMNKNVIWALALPSRVAPYSAAIYLKKSIDNLLKKLDV